jgi:hypothetical protein
MRTRFAVQWRVTSSSVDHTMKNPLRKILCRGRSPSASVTHPSSAEPLVLLPQSSPIPDPPLPAAPTNQLPLPTSLPTQLSVPFQVPSITNQSTYPTSLATTAAASSPPHNSSAATFSSAQHVDASHSAFYQAGRDIIIHNRQLINRTCYFIVFPKPRSLVFLWHSD